MDHTLGLADQKFLEDGKVLYHGTLAKEFTHRYEPYPIHFTHPPMPDSPAWFADNVKFSLHAAARFTNPGEASEIMLHTYKVYGRVSMMSLPDIKNFRAFMKEQFQIDAQLNGLMEGISLAKLSNEPMGLDGYALLKDTVRGEPEYVLFAAGLKKLRAYDPRTVKVIPIDKTHSRLVDASTNNQLAVYTYEKGPGKLD